MARGEGLLAASKVLGPGLVSIAASERERRNKQADEEKAFERKVQLLGIESAIKGQDPSTISKNRLFDVQSQILERQLGGIVGGQPTQQATPQQITPQIPGRPQQSPLQAGVPQQQQPGLLGQRQQEITKTTLGPTGPTFTLEEPPEAKQRRLLQQKGSEKLLDRRLQTQEGFARSMGAFKEIVSQFKAKLRAQGGGGVALGLLGKAQAALRLPGGAAIEASRVQRNDAALALNNVLTGQNRAIKGIVEMIKETLPADLDDEQFAAGKVVQSVKNGFRLVKASQSIDFNTIDPDTDVDVIKSIVGNIKLTPEETQQMNRLIQEILSTPEAQTFDFSGPRGGSPGQLQPQQGQSGQSIGDRALSGDEAAIQELRRLGVFQ